MIYEDNSNVLETKFCRFDADIGLCDGAQIAGYASLFNAEDKGGDVVQKGGLRRLSSQALEGWKQCKNAVAARSYAADWCLG